MFDRIPLTAAINGRPVPAVILRRSQPGTENFRPCYPKVTQSELDAKLLRWSYERSKAR